MLNQHDHAVNAKKGYADDRLVDNGYYSNRQSLVESLPSPAASIDGTTLGSDKATPGSNSQFSLPVDGNCGVHLHSTRPLINT